LDQSGSRLPCANEKTARTLNRREIWFGKTCLNQFFARKGCQADEADKLVTVITQTLKEVYHFGIQIIVSFDRRGRTVNQDRGRTAKRLTVMSKGGRQQW
jgi:hypothetical protein